MEPTNNNLFPVFLRLDTIRTLIVGGGKVGHEKLNALLRSCPDANITIVAETVGAEIKALAKGKTNVTIYKRKFTEADLNSVDLVLLATDDRELHMKIRNAARTKKLLVNVADTPDLCDFYMGSVVNKGDLKIGISTNGKSPTIAKRMRELLEESVPEGTQELLDNMKSIRDQLKGDFEAKVKKLNEVTKGWKE